MLKVLFVCAQNRLRSPTAGQVFAQWPGLETASAGIGRDASVAVSPELLAWADLVFVMERRQRLKLSHRFRPQLRGKRIICLDIPDEFEYMDDGLIRPLKARVPRHLPAPRIARSRTRATSHDRLVPVAVQTAGRWRRCRPAQGDRVDASTLVMAQVRFNTLRSTRRVAAARSNRFPARQPWIRTQFSTPTVVEKRHAAACRPD
jgi:predicted protein tyrosine phosphatase